MSRSAGLGLSLLLVGCTEHLSEEELCARIAESADSGAAYELIYCPASAGAEVTCDDGRTALRMSFGAASEVLARCEGWSGSGDGNEASFAGQFCVGDTGPAFDEVPRGGCDFQVWP